MVVFFSMVNKFKKALTNQHKYRNHTKYLYIVFYTQSQLIVLFILEIMFIGQFKT